MLVSVLGVKVGNDSTQERVARCVTLFVSNDLPKDCAPSFPILFKLRLSDVSVCVECEKRE